MPAHPPELPPPMNHVFVDFENVQQIDLSVIGDKSVSFMLLVGAAQTKLDIDLVEKLMAHAAAVQLVRLTSSGKNALDFALAYYVGRTVVTDPAGYFHIISRDTGFDPLVEHLRSRHIRARRHDDFSTLSFSVPAKALAASLSAKPVVAPVKPAASAKKATKAASSSKTKAAVRITIPEGVAELWEHLRSHAKQRPRTRPRLERFVIAHLGQKLSPAEAAKKVADLEKAGAVTISDKGSVSYSFG